VTKAIDCQPDRHLDPSGQSSITYSAGHSCCGQLHAGKTGLSITLSAEKYDMESCTKKWSQTTASAVQLCKAFEHIGSP